MYGHQVENSSRAEKRTELPRPPLSLVTPPLVTQPFYRRDQDCGREDVTPRFSRINPKTFWRLFALLWRFSS